MKKLIGKIEEIVNTPGGKIASSYKVQINPPDNCLRIILTDARGKGIAFFDCAAPDAYTLASRILKGYDRLEGI